MKQHTSTGFTLIELLIVIAIVSILAAIAFPVFARTRETARQISCMSNMKQLGLAMVQYTQDNNERFTGSDNYGQGWAEHLYPYVNSKQAYVCPDDIRPPSVVGGIQWSNLPYQPDVVSFVANVNILGPTKVQNPTAPMSLSQIDSSASTVLLYEGNHGYAKFSGPGEAANVPVGYSNVCRLDPDETGGTDNSSEVGDGSGNANEVPVDVARHMADNADASGVIHGGSLNLLLVDGHAKFLDMAWDNKAGTVSVGDFPTNGNLYSAISQSELSGSKFSVSFNPNP